MNGSTGGGITQADAAAFFLSPQLPLQRQYEALRAFFAEQIPSARAARRFGYSPGSFRVLAYQFRHDPQKRATFFPPPPRRSRSAPARDRVRELAVAMRKRNLSVYDIQPELTAAGHRIGINALSVLMREEGFARLPRRRDEERPATVKPEAAEVADVRRLDPRLRVRSGCHRARFARRWPACSCSCPCWKGWISAGWSSPAAYPARK
jgi:hypothetical protein